MGRKECQFVSWALSAERIVAETEADAVTVAFSVVAKGASRNELFGISENRVVAYVVREGGPGFLSEVQCVIRIVLKYYCVRSLSRPVPKVVSRVYQDPVLDISVWPCWASRPGNRDVDLRPRPRILVRGKLGWR
jgi:hypothetical protein